VGRDADLSADPDRFIEDPSFEEKVIKFAYYNLDRFDGRSSVRTWLFAIARNRVLDALKSRRRMERRQDPANLDAVPDPRPSVDESIDDQRLHQALAVSVARLPALTQAALLLRYQQGFTFEEMSEICGEKPGTLQARVARALPVLRRRIEAMTGGIHW
jgi:RNA polymerase sigma-70 factor, ECF subfamily